MATIALVLAFRTARSVIRGTIPCSQTVDTFVISLKLKSYTNKNEENNSNGDEPDLRAMSLKGGVKAMSGKQSQVGQELEKFVRAFWLELPVAAANRILGKSDDQALSKAGWKAYDALISLSNEATNQLYRDRTVGALTGRATETALRAQSIGSALSAAFFGNLWPAIGLSTASEISALRTEIAALHEEIADAVELVESSDALATRSFTLTDDGVRVFSNGRAPRVKHEDDDDDAAT